MSDTQRPFACKVCGALYSHEPDCSSTTRIEALEAALREIADDPTGVSIVQAEIAKAALASEQDK